MPVIPDDLRARTGSSTKTLAMRGIAPARGRGLPNVIATARCMKAWKGVAHE
jgi:hypothetical protein